MGKNCCEAKSDELIILRKSQKHVLIIVFAINALMFIVEFVAGQFSHSSSLTADALDMLGDAAVYGFSLFALQRGALWRARAGMLKGLIMLGFGAFVLLQTSYRWIQQSVPVADTMGIFAVIALIANGICLWLLFKHRSDDVNMRSTWLCSRNDIIANIGVILAALLVQRTNSLLPDAILGVLIAILFIKSAASVIIDARTEIAGQHAS